MFTRLLVLCFAVALFSAACGSESGEVTQSADAEATTNTSAPVDDDANDEDANDEADDDGTVDDIDPGDADGDDENGSAEPSDESDDPVAPEEPVAAEPVVYADDFSQSIMPILANNCASCHNPNGPGSSHWLLATAQDVVDTAQVLPAFVTSGYMPPWPASDLSVPFHDNRSLSQDQIDALVAWSATGDLDIDPATPIESPDGVVALGEIDMTLEPLEPYDGSPALLDDYRCLIYDPELTEPTWLNGFKFVPDQTAVVHHAIGNIVPAEARGLADAAAEADTTGGGWTCFGGIGIPADDDIFIAWAPGQDPTQYPEKSGLLMEPGDFIVIQIHYHYEEDAPADASSVELDFLSPDDVADGASQIRIAEYVAPAEIPCSADETGPLCDRATAMERAIGLYGRQGVQADGFNALCGVTPDDFAAMTTGIATGSCELPFYEFGEIVSVFGHMHEIGTKFRMTLNPGRADEQVLLDIPEWDFDWQYNYEPIENIIVRPGDSVLIECEWDRSLIKDGEEPRYIFWSDGTNDEMCFSSVVTRDL